MGFVGSSSTTTTLESAVTDVLTRLGDLSNDIWNRTEIADYIKDGYDKFCTRTKCLFDIQVIENIPITANWQTDLEKSIAETKSGFALTDNRFNFTGEHERNLGVEGKYAGSYAKSPTPYLPDEMPSIEEQGSLIHHWRYDGDYTDEKNADFTFAVVAGTPVFEDSSIDGKGVRVTPNNEKLRVRNETPATMDGGSSFTVTAWMKQNSSSSPAGSSLYQRKFDDGNCWFLHTFQTETIFRMFSTNNDFLTSTGPQMNDQGKWFFLAGVWDDVAKTTELWIGKEGEELTRYSQNTETGTFTVRRLDGDTLRDGFFLVGDITIDNTRLYNGVMSSTFLLNQFDSEKPSGTASVFTTRSLPTKVPGGNLPSSTIEVLRVTYDDKELKGMSSQHMKDIDPNYETRDGDPQFFIYDKDGIYFLRVVPAAQGDATYDTVNGTWGTLTQRFGVSDTIDNPDKKGFGVLRYRDDFTFYNGGPWGTPTRIHPEEKNIEVDVYRLGRDLTSHPMELPLPYQKYVLYWALYQALDREGSGQQLDLASHFKDRFEMGVSRLRSRKQKVNKERIGALASGSPIHDFSLGDAQAPYPYGLPL